MSTHQDNNAPPPASLRPDYFQRFADVFAAIGTLWIFVLMALIVADVVGRNFFDMPITGLAAFAGRSVVAIVFLQLASAIGGGRMTRAGFLLDFFYKRFPRFRVALEAFYCLVGMVMCALIVYASWPEFAYSLESDEFFGVRGVYMVPTWPFRGLLLLGGTLATAAFFVYLLGVLRHGLRHKSIAQ